jgi:hypothetical protein
MMSGTPAWIMFGLGAVAGLVMHHGFFRHGEWHIYTPAIVLGHCLIFALLPLALVFLESPESAARHASVRHYRPGSIITGYLTALATSIVIYRLFLHRLRRFPGPVGARITKAWHMWKCRKSKNHLVLEDLRRKYGDFVRTGKGVLIDLPYMRADHTGGI